MAVSTFFEFSTIDRMGPAGEDTSYVFPYLDDINSWHYIHHYRINGLLDFSVTSGSLDLDNPEYYTVKQMMSDWPNPDRVWKFYYLRYPVTSGTVFTLTPRNATFKFSASETLETRAQFSCGLGDWSRFKVRIDEPSTGKWIEAYESPFWGTLGEGDGDWVHMRIRCSDSGENWDSSNASGVSQPDYMRVIVQTDGRVYCHGFFAHMTTNPLFTAGNELEVSFIITLNDCTKLVLNRVAIQGLYYDYSDIAVDFTPSVESLGFVAMTAEAQGPCIGVASGPAISPVEMVWSGNSCEEHNGLRWSTSGLYGRHGILLDGAGYYMSTDSVDTDFFASCNPAIDYFVQSYFATLDGEYSVYALKGIDSSVFADGMLDASQLSFTFDTDKTECDIEASDAWFKLVGPKSIIDMGPAEPVICLHFGASENVEEAYMTTGGVLTLEHSTPAQSEDLTMVVSGTLGRTPFT